MEKLGGPKLWGLDHPYTRWADSEVGTETVDARVYTNDARITVLKSDGDSVHPPRHQEGRVTAVHTGSHILMEMDPCS